MLDERDVEQLNPGASDSSDDHDEVDAAEAYHATATSFLDRFERFGDLDDLDEAIILCRRAVEVVPDEHPDWAAHQSHLGIALLMRFENAGELIDVDEAIALQRRAVELSEHDFPDVPAHLNNLGNALLRRFEHTGELEDLDDAILAHERTVKATHEDDANLPGRLHNLGSSYLQRFIRVGDLADIEEAISVRYRAVALTPDDDLDKGMYLSGLGNCLRRRFDRVGELHDLNEAIAVQRQAIELVPEDHPARAGRLNNLGIALRERFERVGGLSNLDEAVSVQRQAVDLTPKNHATRAGHLNSLGNALLTRFEHLGELCDVNDATEAQRLAVEATLDEDPHKAMYLTNLGTSLMKRFDFVGGLHDVDEAITTQGHAVDLTPDDHPDRPLHLTGLGNALLTRFWRTGELSDMDEAIAVQCDAVEMMPDGHPKKAICINNLSDSLHARFERVGKVGDINQAIALQRQALNLTPDIHPTRPGRLNNLGVYLLMRFESSGDPSDLDEAILTQRDAVENTSDGYPERPGHLSNLGDSLRTRFENANELEDIDAAVQLHRHALELTPDGHPEKGMFLNHLALSLESRLKQSKSRSDFGLAEKAYTEAAYTLASPSVRLQGALGCTDLYSRYSAFVESPEVLLNMHARVLALIPQVAWLGMTISRRLEEMARLGDAVSAATAAALSVGNLEYALQWFEEGRGIVWGQIQSLRTPMSDLRRSHSELAQKLTDASCALELAGRRRAINGHSHGVQQHRASREGEAVTLRRLAESYQNFLAEVRQLDGFDSFLKPRASNELLQAAADGTVICVNVHDTRCDALILCPSLPQRIQHVCLPQLTSDVAKVWHYRFKVCVHGARASKSVYLGGQTSIPHVLQGLWQAVVKPVFDILANTFQGSRTALPRVTWCTSGALTFLPLHAAGMYDSEVSPRAFNIAISSYTPTLSNLLRRHSIHEGMLSNTSILVVAQPATPMQRPLPGTTLEAAKIRTHFPQGSSELLEGKKVTVHDVLKSMSQHAWIHLACHGVQDVRDPAQSAFLLHDGPLTLHELMSSSSSTAELAFLSACETATGDRNIPNEAVHLTAGMLAAGYRSVVATMWSIGDSEAPLVADVFYKTLLERQAADGKMDVAYALHQAIRALRAEVGVSAFVKWVPFVHFGT